MCGCFLPEADQEILKKGGALCRPSWLADEEKFRLQMVLKGQITLETRSFLAKYFFQYFQIL